MAYTVLNLNDRNFKMSISKQGWADKWGSRRKKYVILIECNGEKMYSTYYDSENNSYNEVEYNGKWFRGIMECVLMDALSAIDSENYVIFAKNYGYEDMREAKRVFEACRSIAYKLEDRFGMTEKDIRKTMDAIACADSIEFLDD